jgi:hypothetical protein
MSIIRPSNINKRLVGTQNVSPGNGGQIGKTKGPTCRGDLTLGSACYGGSIAGMFRLSESYCGVKTGCKCVRTNSGGFIICATPSVYWVVAPATAQISAAGSREPLIACANTCAQTVTGCTGWFVPNCGELYNPGYLCRNYWDSYSSTYYWSSTAAGGPNQWAVDFATGTVAPVCMITYRPTRSFRCISY